MKSIYLFILIILIGKFSYAQLFEEVSDKLGIDYNYPGNDNQEVGAGITIIDVNNDGWDDIFQSGGIFSSKLWINNKGKFFDGSDSYNLTILDSIYVQGAVAADFDNDGYEDLFISNMGELSKIGDNSPPLLLKNIEGKKFVVVMDSIFYKKGHYPTCTWGDINNDGWIDLYLLNYVKYMSNSYDSILDKAIAYIPVCLENQFYLNSKGTSFKELSTELNLNDKGCGLAASFTDYDNDNDMDLILLNDFGSWSHLGNKIYRNEYPNLKFTDLSDSLGFYDEFYGMGVGLGDVNNDGFLDYYVTNIGENRFYLNNKDSLIEQAEQLKLNINLDSDSVKNTSWSGIFLDIENDGDVDLFVAKGYLNSVEPAYLLDSNKLYINHRSNKFEDVSNYSGLNDILAQRGAATLDFDHDGDLDIAIGTIKINRGDFAKTDQKIKLFENKNTTKNNWVAIKLIGENGVNKSCIGCSVTITDKENKTQIREVDGGSGHSSQSSRTLYFGLGKNKYAENITIQWLGGKETKIKKLKGGKCYLLRQNGSINKNY